MKNSYFILSKSLFLNILKNKSLWIIFSTINLLNLLMIILVIGLKNPNNYLNFYVFITSLPIIISIIFGVYIISLTVKLFNEHAKDKIINLESRNGFSKKTIYFSRVTILISFYAIILLALILVNSLSYAISSRDVLSYRVCFIALGWYAIIGLVIFSISLFFSILFNSTWSSLLSILMMFIISIGISLYSIVPVNYQKIDSADVKDEHSLGFNTIWIKYFTNIEREFERIPENQKILEQCQEFYENAFGDAPLNNKYLFKEGPAFWNEDFKEMEESDNEYLNMIAYFHNIFEKNNNSKSKFSDFNIFNDQINLSKTKPMVNFLKQNNTEYRFITNLVENFLNNFKIQTAANIPDKNERLYFGDKNNLFEEVEKTYHNADEFLFFQILQIIFYNQLDLSNEPRVNSSEDEEDIREINAFSQLIKMRNLTNPLGHFNLMYFGKIYSDDNIDYNSINASLYLFGQKYNLKAFKDSEGYIAFETNLDIEWFYFSYFILSASLIGAQYFLFQRKVWN
ncbi:ABC transporter permease [Spiroplasma alleghenense]|uniref:Uncharacterized protein n=1 Tax=Spiroplasma alleghenense TaxID=216931 RepID=A0A345Z2N1_9MOLU|nr:ABC transporter permease [Spiroplasma alleghenense]AXK50860.1 hypothetical protein SALLE_v1c01840 [Spiroplasma alleghenense]